MQSVRLQALLGGSAVLADDMAVITDLVCSDCISTHVELRCGIKVYAVDGGYV